MVGSYLPAHWPTVDGKIASSGAVSARASDKSKREHVWSTLLSSTVQGRFVCTPRCPGGVFFDLWRLGFLSFMFVLASVATPDRWSPSFVVLSHSHVECYCTWTTCKTPAPYAAMEGSAAVPDSVNQALTRQLVERASCCIFTLQLWHCCRPTSAVSRLAGWLAGGTCKTCLQRWTPTRPLSFFGLISFWPYQLPAPPWYDVTYCRQHGRTIMWRPGTV